MLLMPIDFPIGAIKYLKVEKKIVIRNQSFYGQEKVVETNLRSKFEH